LKKDADATNSEEDGLKLILLKTLNQQQQQQQQMQQLQLYNSKKQYL